MVKKISKNDFQKEVLEYKGIALVDFYADWCGPCRIVSPIIEELAKELTNIKFIKIDVDENQELATQYSIFSIPTFLIFKEGKLINQLVGVLTKESFLDELKKIMD